MVEILTGALSGGDVVRHEPTGHSGNCVFMLVLDPEHFGGATHFATEVKDLAAFVRSCPTIAAGEELTIDYACRPTRRSLASVAAPSAKAGSSTKTNSSCYGQST
jgi:LDH2 family malate/lactate/ureidoglycolate dehydrogenase